MEEAAVLFVPRRELRDNEVPIDRILQTKMLYTLLLLSYSTTVSPLLLTRIVLFFEFEL